MFSKLNKYDPLQRVVRCSCFPLSRARDTSRSTCSSQAQQTTFLLSCLHVRFSSSASLYVHWPFCRKRCTYCNFNKYIRESVDHNRMKECLVQETVSLINMAEVDKISSIFFGGGTPSLANPETLKAVIDSVNSTVYLPDDVEISMEINPTSMQASLLRKFMAVGINRVSIGIQTLRKEGLHVLGRDHSVSESLRCLETACHLFPGKVSLDLIFGWPGQQFDMWKQELEQILSLCDNHISLYQLTLEPGTALHKQVQLGHLEMPESVEDMYLFAVEYLQRNGYERYEVSNFCKQDHYCQHNISYWNGGQYIGVGPGAHGRFQPVNRSQREARIQSLSPDDWMVEVEQTGHGTRSITPLSLLDRQHELLAAGLRTKWGVTNLTWSMISPDRSLFDLTRASAIQIYFSDGFLFLDECGLRASEKGINIIDTIIVSLYSALEDELNKQKSVT